MNIHICSKVICGQCRCEYCPVCHNGCPQCHKGQTKLTITTGTGDYQEKKGNND